MPGVSLNGIMQNWEMIRKIVKGKHPPTEALLNSCRLSMKAGVLQLGFSAELLKTKMEAENSLKITVQAIKQVLGQEVPVVCVVLDAKGGPIQRDEDVDADGMVNEALNLGAKIVQKE